MEQAGSYPQEVVTVASQKMTTVFDGTSRKDMVYHGDTFMFWSDFRHYAVVCDLSPIYQPPLIASPSAPLVLMR